MEAKEDSINAGLLLPLFCHIRHDQDGENDFLASQPQWLINAEMYKALSFLSVVIPFSFCNI